MLTERRHARPRVKEQHHHGQANIESNDHGTVEQGVRETQGCNIYPIVMWRALEHVLDKERLEPRNIDFQLISSDHAAEDHKQSENARCQEKESSATMLSLIKEVYSIVDNFKIEPGLYISHGKTSEKQDRVRGKLDASFPTRLPSITYQIQHGCYSVLP
jgi:hypothetical protein